MGAGRFSLAEGTACGPASHQQLTTTTTQQPTPAAAAYSRQGAGTQKSGRPPSAPPPSRRADGATRLLGWLLSLPGRRAHQGGRLLPARPAGKSRPLGEGGSTGPLRSASSRGLPGWCVRAIPTSGCWSGEVQEGKTSKGIGSSRVVKVGYGGSGGLTTGGSLLRYCRPSFHYSEGTVTSSRPRPLTVSLESSPDSWAMG